MCNALLLNINSDWPKLRKNIYKLDKNTDIFASYYVFDGYVPLFKNKGFNNIYSSADLLTEATVDAFYKKYNCAVIINTSFNIRGEPIVCTPIDAYKCFMSTEMDYLIIGNYLLDKSKQNTFDEKDDRSINFDLD